MEKEILFNYYVDDDNRDILKIILNRLAMVKNGTWVTIEIEKNDVIGQNDL